MAISRPVKGHAIKTLTIHQQTDQAIAGHFKFDDSDYAIDLDFDLAVVQEGQGLARPGVAIASDGGAPGKALLATMAATQAGDKTKILASMQAMIPSALSISGGNQDGDTAWVDFTGKLNDKAMQGTAVLVQLGGDWFLKTVTTRQ